MNYRISIALFVGASVVSASLVANWCHAAEPQVAVRQMLTIGWEKQYSARAEADALFHRFTTESGVDRNMSYAYALVLLQQGRYADADPVLRSTLRFDPTQAAPRRALIRNLMLLKRYQAALAEGETLSEQLATLDVAAAPSDDARMSAALLGRVHSYLSGPGEDTTLRNELRQLASGTELWPAELQQEFKQAQADVEQIYADIQSQLAQFQQKTEKELEEQREILAESVAERKEQLGDRQQQIDDQAAKVTDETRDELNALVAQEQPLAAGYADLERRAILVKRDLAPIVFDINQLFARADETENPVERDILLSRADRLQRIAARYEAELAALSREAARINAQVAGLRQQQAVIRGRYASDQQRLAQQQKGIAKGEKVLESDRRKLDRGLRAPSGGIRSLKRQATAYSTYDAFDLAQQRQQLLKLSQQ